MVASEEGIQIFVLQKLHVFIKIALHTADPGQITGEFIRLHIQLIQLGSHNIPFEIDMASDEGSADLADQKLPVHYINIHGQILDSGRFRVDLDFFYPSVFNIQRIIQILIDIKGLNQSLWNFFLRIGQSQIGTAFNMGVQHRLEIEISSDIGL